MPPEPGLIEFLPPDERAFGAGDAEHGGAGATFVGFDPDDWEDTDARDEAPRSRWLPILTGLAMTGLLAGGVVAASPWSGGDEDAAGPPTTEPTPTTVIAPAPITTATAAPLDASRTGWLLDPVPDGFRPAYFAQGEARLDDLSGWGEVWASPGATRVSGRWFSITLQPFLEFEPGIPESWFPIEVTGRAAHATMGPDGVASLAYDAGQPDSSRLVTIEAYGMGLDEMTTLAASIAIVDDRPQLVDDRPEFTRPELLAGLERIAATPTDMELATRVILGGTQRTRALYAGPGRFEVTLVEEQPPDVFPAGVDVARLAALAFAQVNLADGWGPKDDFEGENLVIGYRTIDGFDLLVARWRQGETEMSLLTTGDLGDLLEMLPDVELVSAEEWAAAERSVETASVPQDVGPRAPPGITVDAGVLANGTDWSVRHWHSSDEWDVRVGGNSFFAPRRPATSMTPVTMAGATLVLVHSDVAGTTAVAVFADGTSTTVPLAATDPADQTSFMGVVPIEPAGAFTVEVVAADGSVVSRFAPWEPISANRQWRVIEFVPPRDGAFGHAETADFVGFDGADSAASDDEPPRSPWLTGLAVAGVIALIAGGSFAAAPWKDDSVAAPPTSSMPTTTDTIAATASRVASSAARGLPDGVVTTPAGWVLDQPGRFIAVGAQSNGSFVGPGDAYDLWRDTLASRTTGAFIAIDSQFLLNGVETMRKGGVRIMVGDRPALLWTAPDGVVEIQVATPTGLIVITSGGVGLTDLVTIAATVNADVRDRNTLDYHGIDEAADGPFAGLIRVVNGGTEVYPGADQVGTALSWTSYVDPRDGDYVELRVLATGRDEQLINDLVLSRPLTEDAYGPDDAATVDRLIRSGRNMQLRITTSGNDRLIARMQLGDDTQLLVTGDVELHELLDIVGRVQPAAPETWRALLLDTMNGVDLALDHEWAPLFFSGEGPANWQATVYDGRFDIGADDSWSSNAFSHGSGPELTEYRTIERALLRATTTFPDSARSIVVTQAGHDQIAASLIEFDRSAVFVAVIELDAALPYTVQWLDADGVPVPGPEVATP